MIFTRFFLTNTNFVNKFDSCGSHIALSTIFFLIFISFYSANQKIFLY